MSETFTLMRCDNCQKWEKRSPGDQWEGDCTALPRWSITASNHRCYLFMEKIHTDDEGDTAESAE